MRYFASVYLFCAFLLLTSCADEYDRLVPEDVAAVFTTGLSGTGTPASQASSRATNDSWTKGDSVGIYMVPYNTDAAAAADFNIYPDSMNVKHVALSGGTSVSLSPVSDAILLPQNASEKVSFVAYYPYMKDITNTTYNNIYPVDVTTQKPLAAIDLLYHKDNLAYSRDKKDAALSFSHQLSKVTVTVVRKSIGIIDFTSVDTGSSLVGFPRKAKFDLSNGTLTNVSDPSTVASPLTPVKNTDIKSPADSVVFESIVVPHKGKDYTRTIRVDIDGTTYSYTLPQTRDFESGTVYRYKFIFTGNGLDMGESTISNWGTSTVGDIEFSVSTNSIELGAAATTGNTFTIKTNSVPTPTCSISTSATSVVTPGTSWITNVSFGTPSVSNGWKTYTATFNTTANTSETTANELYLHLKITEGKTLVVKVKQEKKIYLRAPSPSSFSLTSIDQSSSFTVTTNSSEVNPVISYTSNGTAVISRPSWLAVDTPIRTVSSGIATFTTKFSVLDNYTSTATRTAYIHITINGIEQKVSVTQAGEAIAGGVTVIAPADESNCYIIATGGKELRFPVKRAVTNGGMSPTAAFTAEVLWDDTGVIGTPTIVGTLSGSYVSVKTTDKAGNALVAVKSGGTIYWSYHIWVTDYNPNNNTYTNTYNTNNNGSHFVFMDRNLGATKAGTGSGLGTGLFYQWGRKDPFPATGDPGVTQTGGGKFTVTETSVTLGTIANSIKNPNVFYTAVSVPNDWYFPSYNNELWGSSGNKTVYDPCPTGWRVPTSKYGAPWYGFTKDNGGTFNSGHTWGANAAFPAPGVRNYTDGVLSNSGNYSSYWSASSAHASYGALNLRIYSTIYVDASNGRAYGFNIRCVKE